MTMEDMAAQAAAEIDAALSRVRAGVPDSAAASWKVTVPEHDADGVVIRRFQITEREASIDKLRAALNPQRSDRSIDPGWYTRLIVDGTLWMTDTPAEVRDLDSVDMAMRFNRGGSMLIVGLGIGLVLHRAITRRGITRIDVVEREQRVIDAVGPHYLALAAEYGCELHFHCADIHAWRPARGLAWSIGFFDIWADIDMDDRPEVDRLRRRFRSRVRVFDAWAQDERNAQARRIRQRRGFY